MNDANATNKRNYKIDNIRAIAILLVVFGHSIILYSSSWNLYKTTNDVPSLNICKDIINLIQMPLFFALSGFLFVSTLQKKSFSLVLKDKTKRLLIPYFVFAFFWLLPIRLIVKYPGYNIPISKIIVKCILYGSDNGHLWYLIALFWCFVFCYLLYSVVKTAHNKSSTPQMAVEIDQKVTFYIVFLISIVMYVMPKIINLFYFNSTFNYFIWFMLGCIIRINYEELIGLKQIYRVLLIIMCLLLTVLSLFIVSNGVLEMILEFIISLLWVIGLFNLIPNRNNKALSFISSISFGLYLFHSPLVYITYSSIPNANPCIVVLINFIVFGGLSVILTYLLKKSNIKVVIGE